MTVLLLMLSVVVAWIEDRLSVQAVLGMPGPPNLAGTLVRSIQTDFTSFWAVSGNLKILFIFVHSVHFMNKGQIFCL